MCMVSAIMDYGIQTWPNWNNQVTPVARDQIVLEMSAYLELVRKAEEFDKLANQPDCVDPKKAELVQKIKDLLKEYGQDV